MKMIPYYDRASKQQRQEKVYGTRALQLAYGDSFLAPLLRNCASRLPWISTVVGWWQKQPWTRKKIVPFIRDYGVDASEFAQPTTTFSSFNDFFVRKLKPEARPLAPHIAIIPADGRYHFFPCYNSSSSLFIKGQHFSLAALLQDEGRAAAYVGGTVVVGRLCPSDYHRFHFPCTCRAGVAQLINGPLFSVNPIALKRNASILSENRRFITELHTPHFGTILFIEVGATNVGSVTQTYDVNTAQNKGDEKGFFSFGGSAIILLFQPGVLTLASDLTDYKGSVEIRCLMGQPLSID